MTDWDLLREWVETQYDATPAVKDAMAEIDSLLLQWWGVELEPIQAGMLLEGIHFAWLVSHEYPEIGPAMGSLIHRHSPSPEASDVADAAKYGEEIVLLAKLAWYSDGGERTEAAS